MSTGVGEANTNYSMALPECPCKRTGEQLGSWRHPAGLILARKKFISELGGVSLRSPRFGRRKQSASPCSFRALRGASSGN